MLKKTIEFEDLDGNKLKEDFYFHLSKADLIALELSKKGGLVEFMKKIVEIEDGERLVEMFQKIILLAYGKKSEDGRGFIKNDKLREEFASTDAYSELFTELATNAESASEFMNGIVPAGMSEVTTSDQPSKALTEMTKEELLERLNAKP